MVLPVTSRQRCDLLYAYTVMETGNMKELEGALRSGLLDVNGCRARGFVPLILAACLGQMPAAELLIAKGADVNLPFRTDILEPDLKNTETPHSHGERPLHAAAKYCHVDIVLLLIRAGAEVNAADIDGLTPLHRSFPSQSASPQGRCDIAQALLGAGGDPCLPNNHGAIPLHYAAQCGNIDAIDLLLSKAPETINQQDGEGWTALGYAAGTESADAVAHLLVKGASPKVAFPAGCMLCQAIMCSSEGVVRAIIRHTDSFSDISPTHSAVSIAVFVGQARILRDVLEKDGEDLKMHWARTHYNGTCTPLLHFAAGHGILSSVRVLLAAGAMEAQTDAHGRRARDVVGTMDSEKYTREKIRIEAGRDETLTLRRRFRDRDSKACAAIRRLLEQGPAFRSHSWGWPASRAAASRNASRGGAPQTSSGRATTIPVVRIFRPKQTAFFAGMVGRYASRQELLLRKLNPLLAPSSSV